MLKCIVFLLLIITASCSIVPCCIDDNCGAEATLVAAQEQERDQRPKNDPGACSPFFNCSTCVGGVECGVAFVGVRPANLVSSVYPSHLVIPLSSYNEDLFQPPRLS